MRYKFLFYLLIGCLIGVLIRIAAERPPKEDIPYVSPVVSTRLWHNIIELREGGAGEIVIQEDVIIVYNKEGKLTDLFHAPIPWEVWDATMADGRD